MSKPQHAEILSVAEMYAADRAAGAAGRTGTALMEAAGAAVAREIAATWSPRPALVACGPGNNGGDGFVAARHLVARGWPITVATLEPLDRLRGDAAIAATRWISTGGPAAIKLDPEQLSRHELFIDALFGAGLNRGLEGVARDVVDAVNQRRVPTVAIDVPSGLHGDTGAVLPSIAGGRGVAPQATLTVTFFRQKPAHVLFPGKSLCGRLVVADIGIPADVLHGIAPCLYVNQPGLWHLPVPTWASHKYTRGHAVVFGGVDSGAARLAARAARRIGAGLLTLAVPSSAMPIYAADAPGAFVKAADSTDDVDAILRDTRRNAVLIGPGFGVGPVTADRVLRILETDKAVVVDADALSSFASQPDVLFSACRDRKAATVFTPHEGEFARLFQHRGGKVERARAAAEESGAVVILKGADTVVADPQGTAAISADTSSWLATGGSGDVLAGYVLGLIAQGLTGFEAAAAAVWLHCACGLILGPGLIAEDLPESLSDVLKALVEK